MLEDKWSRQSLQNLSKSGLFTARVSQTDQLRDQFKNNAGNLRKSQETKAANNITDSKLTNSKLTNGSIVVQEKSLPSHGSFLGSFNRKKKAPMDAIDTLLPNDDSGKALAIETNQPRGEIVVITEMSVLTE